MSTDTSPLLLDGRALAAEVRSEFAAEVQSMIEGGRRPRLVVLQVGRNEAAQAYIRGQKRGAESWDLEFHLETLPADASDATVRKALRAFNADKRVSGILLSLPLPAGLGTRTLQREIHPSKDVEGVHPENLGGLLWARYGLLPCTALAALALVDQSGIDLQGKEAVVVGHSEIVGKPASLLLLARNATVTVCHKFTADLAAHTRRADVLIVAVGKAGLITADMVKQGAVVIDVGINAVPSDEGPGRMRLVGDVAYDEVAPKCAAITPVPGGVGPVTVAMLMRNTVLAARGMPPLDDPGQLPLFA
ncbi:MAG: bifunctional 5,10-methylenetetrahydrofolate dehydrogenase/5,10-methenyltetrahydrofolate cyclohydrolase [Planctomycetota bacterium]|nr:bifunctional 5,10-methylenetetrahydrofolate dehydrogenase/5,10-methenyltetrahydrofolate cyclohydrolase [Planctomycetota bacterium]